MVKSDVHCHVALAEVLTYLLTPMFFFWQLLFHFISLKVCVLDVSGSMGSRNKIDDLTLGFCHLLWWIVMSVTCGYMKRKMIDLENW